MASKINLVQFLVFMLDALGNNDPQTKDNVSSKLQAMLGNNWAALPVNSLTMLAVITVLTQVLEPLGITPKNIAMTAIDLAEQLGETEAAKEVGEKIKNMAKMTADLFNQAFNQALQKIDLEKTSENIKKGLENVKSKTKDTFGSLSKLKKKKK